ncbi:bifunctional 3-oxoadipate enol-lactonase/4-carboxymuconolactone decarboxylase PcaDC [Streptomyces litchfieldiae]|uniref:Alpha/beta fold hydrolase n=1 Tax=Streptomyces litchfieldiae TaxID=3075543 RepID=A0ABU2MI67_9ACTN|nr:alpha/beta fold hydrolase [Streptomyces sp. DSM 44938]MDT0341269.1 alpha/beta fold hydrolase [Streptomyces sp. DSM 44938]
MPTALLHHTVDGPACAPPLLLGNSLGTSTALWDGVARGLSATRRVVRWDLPGHGRSAAGLIAPGATVADLADHVLGLADHLGLDRFSYAGVSLGGAIGLHLAVHHPERVDRLGVLCASASFGDPRPWRRRAALVRRAGTAPVADTAAARWFTPGFSHPGLLADLRATAPEAYAACCDALAAYDLRGVLASIGAPTLIMAGREDPVTPPAHAREIADAIPGAALIELPRTSHLAPAERPEAVLVALRGHFAPAREAGMAVRRAVLGDAHVDRAQARTTLLTEDFQDFITRYAWGEVWTDPTLDRRERSLITLAALVAHGHWDELALHAVAARRNGLTPEEISAVLRHMAVYCGVPAANKAFATVQRALDDVL